MLKVGPAEANETRQVILTTLKRYGPVTIEAIARRLRVTHEAVRQHMVTLVRHGWVEPCKPRGAPRKKSGRPPTRYCLSVKGDHLFPKHYDLLTLNIMNAVSQTYGDEAILDIFAAMADETVAAWRPSVARKPLAEKLAGIRDRYARLDRATSIEKDNGGYRMIERNCPFLNVALERPALCSVTVNVLTRLLQCKVVRTERFQNGDGRCVFQIFPKEPIKFDRFVLEPSPMPSGAR